MCSFTSVDIYGVRHRLRAYQVPRNKISFQVIVRYFAGFRPNRLKKDMFLLIVDTLHLKLEFHYGGTAGRRDPRSSPQGFLNEISSSTQH